MNRFCLLAIAFALLGAGCNDKSSTTTPSTTPTRPTLVAALLPSNEVPLVTNAEASGSGNVTITFDVTRDSGGNITSAAVNFDVVLTGFPAGTPMNVAHIHKGPPTCACPVVVNTTLTAGQVVLTNGSGFFSKAGIAVDPALATAIVNDPSAFYFNVHSTSNPGGAARGPLSRIQ